MTILKEDENRNFHLSLVIIEVFLITFSFPSVFDNEVIPRSEILGHRGNPVGIPVLNAFRTCMISLGVFNSRLIAILQIHIFIISPYVSFIHIW